MAQHKHSVAAATLAIVALITVMELARVQIGAEERRAIATAKVTDVEPKVAPAAMKLLECAEITPEGGFNFYTTHKGKRQRAFAITPQGSLVAGGVSRTGTPVTNDPPVINPVEYDKAGAHGGRDWIHDFYFGRFEQGEGQPRLYSRGLFLWGRGDSPDIQLGRTGPDNPPTTYGPPLDTEPGACLGKIVFLNWGDGEFQGDLASIMARGDKVATKTKNPGSLHLMTAGSSVVTSEAKIAQAWRDGIDRLVIQSNGYVAIGDDFSNAKERLHVQGNILAEKNIIAQGDVIASGVKKFSIEHPTKPGTKLTHAAIEGPEAAVYYRGEAQLQAGKAVVQLPDYFEKLTRPEGRTVMLTNVDGFDRLCIERQNGRQVADGQFTVVSENRQSSQAFTWEVKAQRADVDSFIAEEQSHTANLKPKFTRKNSP